MKVIALAVTILIVVVAIISLLLTGATTYGANHHLARATGWEEVGAGSATKGGISNNSGQSGDPSAAIDLSGNAYVAWHDDTSNNFEVYVRQWTGRKWKEVGINSASGGGISNNSRDSRAVSLAITPSGKPCAAWRDKSSGFAEIYMRCWNGSAWEEVGGGSARGVGVSDQQGSSDKGPSLAIAPDGQIYLAWDNSDGNDSEIYAAKWDGSSWISLGSSGGKVSDNIGASLLPSLALTPDGTPYIAWQDESSGNFEIYLRRWNGSSWIETSTNSASGGGVSNSSGFSRQASLKISSEGIPYLAWADDSDGNNEIFVRRWDGTTWAEVGAGSAADSGISNNSGDSKLPSIAISHEEVPCISWQDNTEGSADIYVRCWTGTVWDEAGDNAASKGGISSNPGTSNFPIMVFDKEYTGYVVWGDNSNGNFEIYVRRRIFDDNPPQPTPTTVPIPSPTVTPIPSPTATPISENSQTIMLPLIISSRPVLFVGFRARWDGEHHIRDTEHTRIGVHLIRDATELADINTIILENRLWYEPNPLDWEERKWVEHLSLSTGEAIWNSAPPDPSWKWESPWIMPSNWSFEDNQTVDIGGQQFRVTGPHNGVTSFGSSVHYWKLSNENQFLFWDDGGSWTQMVYSGEIDLWYDIDTRLMLHRDITRILYYEGKETSFTVQNFINLSSSNAFP